MIAMFLFKTNGKAGLRLYKIPALVFARSLFQMAHPESKILKVDVFYNTTKAQEKLIPELGDAGLEERVSIAEEEGRPQGSIGAPKSTPTARQNGGRQKWQWKGRPAGGPGHRPQTTNQQRWQIKPKQFTGA